MRALDSAKSRLRPATTTAEDHRNLVMAMRRDSISAVASARGTARILIVTEQVEEVESSLATAAVMADVVVIADPPGSGLNNALRHAAAFASERWPADGVAAIVADLPALSPATFDLVLQAAAEYRRGFVVDRHHSGTTLLTAAPGVALEPMFGRSSAGRHAASGAIALPAAASVRSDVDLAEDLDVVVNLGVGPATLEQLALTAMCAATTS
jgi:2-phospho-L-lactate guanylyltransferase